MAFLPPPLPGVSFGDTGAALPLRCDVTFLTLHKTSFLMAFSVEKWESVIFPFKKQFK